MNENLKQFYKEMQTWIEAGCPTHPVFVSDDGLCLNLHLFTEKVLGEDWNYSLKLRQVLSKQFSEAGLSWLFPFNEGPNYTDAFREEIENHTLYKNKARLAWVKEHANE